MASIELEARVAILENELTKIKSLLEISKDRNQPWWEKVAGTFSESEIFPQVVNLGQEYRQSSNQETNDFKEI